MGSLIGEREGSRGREGRGEGKKGSRAMSGSWEVKEREREGDRDLQREEEVEVGGFLPFKGTRYCLPCTWA